MRAHLRCDVLLVQPPHHAAQPSQCAAHHKHAHKQALDTVTQRLDHFAVLHTSAYQQPNLGTAQYPGQHGKNKQAHHHRQQTVFFNRGIAQQHRTAQAFRQGQRDLRWTPDDFDQLFTNDHAAHGDQNLFQVLTINRPHNKSLKRQSQRTRHRHRHQHRREDRHQVAPQLGRASPVAHQAQHSSSHKRTEGNKHAMTKVQHVHQAKHQCQA